MSNADWQPTLESDRLILRPLRPADFEALARTASDPLIWEQHPDRERWRDERFRLFFEGGLESRGALAAIEKATGEIVGSSRYTDHDAAARTVEIGYSFLSRRTWRTGINREMKGLMLEHAFRFVDAALFFVGVDNARSRAAMEGLGAEFIGATERTGLRGQAVPSVAYRIKKSEWLAKRQ